MEYPEYPDSRYCTYPMRVGVPQYYLDLDEANAGKPTWRKEYACTPNGSRMRPRWQPPLPKLPYLFKRRY